MEAKYNIYLYVDNINDKTILTLDDNFNDKKYICSLVIYKLFKYMALNIIREASVKLKGNKHFTNYQKRLNVLLPILHKYNIQNILHLG